jgi:LytS/YehU family sensor histidine kinase
MTKDCKIRREVDPHFFLNSFTTLAHLIHADPDKAYLFNNKLAQVYKYYLLNRDRELVALEDELQFLEDYFFLLQVRHDNKLHLFTETVQKPARTKRVVPFSLQFLIDHAIKHNQFSELKPLNILIKINEKWTEIINNDSQQIDFTSEEQIGLQDLNERYKKCCMREIDIQQNGRVFTVRIPVIIQNKT